MIDRETLKTEISKLLTGADLNAITSKKIRADLEQRLQADLSDRRKEIDELIAAVLEAENKAGSDTDSSSDSSEILAEKPKQQKPKLNSAPAAAAAAAAAPASNGDICSDSDSDSDAVGDASELTDEQLARKLHERENALPRRRRAAAATGANNRQAKRRRSEPASGAACGKRRESAFSRPCLLSDTLAAVVGCDSMPRQQVVKRLWEIARDREMFDPKNKQFIICDQEFERLFGKKRVRMFGAMKYLKSHIRTVENQ